MGWCLWFWRWTGSWTFISITCVKQKWKIYTTWWASTKLIAFLTKTMFCRIISVLQQSKLTSIWTPTGTIAQSVTWGIQICHISKCFHIHPSIVGFFLSSFKNLRGFLNNSFFKEFFSCSIGYFFNRCRFEDRGCNASTWFVIKMSWIFKIIKEYTLTIIIFTKMKLEFQSWESTQSLGYLLEFLVS